MKKKLTILLVVMMMAALTSCNKKQETNNVDLLRKGVLTLDNSEKTGIKDYERVGNNVKTEEEKEKTREAVKAAGGFKHYDNLTSAILGLDRGDIDTLHIPEPVVDYIMKQNKNKYHKAKAKKSYTFLTMAAVKDKKSIIDEINVGLKTIKENGKLDEIYKKYIENLNTESNITLPHFNDAKTIKVAITGDLPPIDYIDASGNAQGFNIALLSALADAMHVNFELVKCESGARAIMATSGKADVIFWMSGRSYGKSGDEVDYSEDVPDNMVVSDSYLIVPRTSIFLDSNEKMKERYKDRMDK